MDKKWLDFGEFDPIFKITRGLRMLENGLSASCIQKELVDLDYTYTYTVSIVTWTRID